MSDVPGEILSEILSRLPVLPLMRFRCVSKPWKCLIDSNEFIRHHLNRSLKNTDSNLNIILESHHLHSADFDLLNETNQAHFHELAHPSRTKLGNQMQVLGSCHGLLVLSEYPYHNTTILWNPSITRFHELPYENVQRLDPVTNYISHGFGYDVVNDDYKLVRLVQVNVDADNEVKVYSLKSNSWRRIPDFPYYLQSGSLPGEFANGALHWRVGKKVNSDTASFVMAFDLGSEKFSLVPLPETAGNNTCMTVFVWGGCLSLNLFVDDNVNIWVMKEYGVQESWSFFFTFKCSDELYFIRPLAYSKCNRKVLLGCDGGALKWYDLDKKSTVFPMLQMPIDIAYGMFTCLQSLVLLDSGTCDFGH